MTPKMLARFINAHTAQSALPPLPKISEATIDMADAHRRGILAHRAAKRAKRSCGIHANRDDKTDSLERRARDMFGMHGDKDCSLQMLRQGSGGYRPFGRQSHDGPHQLASNAVSRSLRGIGTAEGTAWRNSVAARRAERRAVSAASLSAPAAPAAKIGLNIAYSFCLGFLLGL
jgi:hypothetical protein